MYPRPLVLCSRGGAAGRVPRQPAAELWRPRPGLRACLAAGWAHHCSVWLRGFLWGAALLPAAAGWAGPAWRVSSAFCCWPSASQLTATHASLPAVQSSTTTRCPTCASCGAVGMNIGRHVVVAAGLRRRGCLLHCAAGPAIPACGSQWSLLPAPILGTGLGLPVLHHRDSAPSGAAAPAAPHRHCCSVPAGGARVPHLGCHRPAPPTCPCQAGRGGQCAAGHHGRVMLLLLAVLRV